MAKADFYRVLGVERSADKTVLKAAFRNLAKKYHPDTNPDDTDARRKFEEINEAYEVLSDDDKRAAYDRLGHAAFDRTGGGGGAQGFGGFGNFGGSVNDIFEEFFGGGGGARQRRRTRAGGDRKAEVSITLAEAYAGLERQLDFARAGQCNSCGGSGAAQGTQPTTCTTCNGHGKLRRQQGFFTVERPCHACGGAGRIIATPCPDCKGGGRKQQQRSVSFNIPAGIENGMRIRLAGEGDAGAQGAPSGDLYIYVTVAAHAFLERDGADLFCTMPIPFPLAASGGMVDVPMLDGNRVKLSIPEGAQSEQQFRLRGKGMPRLQSRARGDLYVRIRVETPQGLTRMQKKLLDAFGDTLKDKNFPNAAAFKAHGKRKP